MAMERLMELLRKPGARKEVQGVAPTQRLAGDNGNGDNVRVYVRKAKGRMLDRWLDWVVAFSGSELVFFSILAGLLIWALLGIRFGKKDGWQVLISDVQAIISYSFDSLLVRQQLNGFEDEMQALAQVQSRLLSHARMLRKLRFRLKDGEDAFNIIPAEHVQALSELRTELPQETRFGRIITSCAHVFGHLVTIILFWIGVLVWIGIGPLRGWGVEWELYMNSASSALMVFIFSFLANIRERHAAYVKKCLDTIFTIDSALELRLRALTGDSLSNDLVVIPAPKVNRVQRVIFYYADFVGTLVGVGILLAVIIVWAAVGPVLQFSSNWWLLIGTYAGLVGMNDGFVLRNMQARLGEYVDGELAKIDAEDEELFTIFELPLPPHQTVGKKSLTDRLSETMNSFCAHELTVVAGFLVILALIAGATAMRWTTAGQLLCNVPPSLIESFFMIILITGHNSADTRKRVDLQNICERRFVLLSSVSRIQPQVDEKATAIQPQVDEKATTAEVSCKE